MAAAGARPRSATFSPAATTILPSWPGLSAATGASRTPCTGFSTSPSVRMTAGGAIAPPPATSPCYVKSPATSSPQIAAVKPAFVVGAKRPPGTTTTCSRSSPARLMREPWVEEERARLIVVETVRRIVAAEYDEVWRKPKLAAKCRAVQLFEQVSPAMAKAQAVLPLECAKQALKGFRGCLPPDLRVGSPCAAAAQAAARSFRKRFGPGADRKIWEMTARILEEAILFGRNDGIDDLVAAAERLERAKVLTAPV